MLKTNELTKLGWSEAICNRIHEAVHDECKRTKVASKFIPLYGPVSPGALTVPSDSISIEPDGRQALTVEEAATTPLIELFVEFTLTPQQVEREQELMTAVTLATRAANLLSQAEDVVLFQGQSAINGENQHPLFSDKKVHVLSGPAGKGLLNSVQSENQIVKVPPDYDRQQRYGENTFGAVAEAYSRLQSGEDLAQAHYGPYALVLHHVPYADTYAPLPTTLIMSADRIKPLVTYTNPKTKEAEVEFYGTGTLPKYRGLLVSLGGNTMDLVVGVDAKTEFLTEDQEGRYRFRVFERFALRLKDPSAVMRLEFESGDCR